MSECVKDDILSRGSYIGRSIKIPYYSEDLWSAFQHSQSLPMNKSKHEGHCLSYIKIGSNMELIVTPT